MPDDHFIELSDHRLLASLEIDAVLHTWQARISDTIENTSQSLIAHASLVPVQPEFGQIRIVVGDDNRVDLPDMDARLILHRRGNGDSKNAPSIGSIMFMEPDRRFFDGKVSVFAEINVDAFLFDGLMARHDAGIEMPAVFRLPLEERGEFEVVERKPVLTLAFGRTRKVMALRWSSDMTGPGDRAGEGVLLNGAFHRVLQRYRWQENGWRLTKSQFLDIVSELTASAILTTHREKMIGLPLDTAISKAFRIGHAFFDVLISGEAVTRKERRDAKSKKRPDLDRDISWSKRDPLKDFAEGLDYPWRSSIDRSKVDPVVQEYMISGFISPTLEFLFADILAYAEIRAYGDVLKGRPGAVGWIVSLQEGRCRGNLTKMQLYAWPWMMAWELVKKATWLGLPLFVAFSLWGEGRRDEAWMVLAGVAAIAFGGERIKSWFVTDRKERVSRAKADMDRFDKMNDAYRLLYQLGSPFIAREALQAAASHGAVWPELLWQVILSAEGRNRIAWENGDPQYRRLRGEIWRSLTEAYLAQERAGTPMPKPDLENWEMP